MRKLAPLESTFERLHGLQERCRGRNSVLVHDDQSDGSDKILNFDFSTAKIRFLQIAKVR